MSLLNAWWLLILIPIIALILDHKIKGPAVLALKVIAEQQFLGIVVHCDDARYGLVAAEAEIMMENETFGNRRSNRPAHYTLKRFVRNAHGEYFMTICGEAKPYVKHVEHRLAKIELKDKYKPA